MARTMFPGPQEVRDRLAGWQSEWDAVASCTEPADRPRAEAALGSLYELSGRKPPAFLWVGSPDAGAFAYVVARMRRQGIVGEFAVGDIGNGANREWNGLAQPFGLDPVWTRRLASAVLRGLPPDRQRGAGADPYLGAAQALGSTTHRLARYVQLTVRPLGTLGEAPVVPEPDTDTLAAALGPVWHTVSGAIGPDLARQLFLDGLIGMADRLVARPSVEGRLSEAAHALQPGQWDGTTPVLAAARDVIGGHIWRLRQDRAEHERLISLHLELARSAGPWWALDGLAILTDRPLRLRRDDAGRPHAADGPAVVWPDGTEAFAWHGLPVDRRLVTEPDTITLSEIDAERNVELRRVLVERFGEERLIREGGARLVHEDETGRLWRRPLAIVSPWSRHADEPIVMVEVQNSTPEADGSRHTYFLRVPPGMRTAREAVAWTFGLGEGDYHPTVES